ncbi:MAG: hypothetical protein KF892_24405 [Rhizobacter sp.]|nr:hypothetical protein [Rhizobacter sp.]
MPTTSELTPRDFLDYRDAINARLKATRQIELRVAVYAYAQEAYIVSATTGFSEAGAPVKVPFAGADEELGRTVRKLLLQTHMHPAPSHREAKLSDWAAYVLSGAKTGRAFEEKSVYLSVDTRNTALCIRAQQRRPPSPIYVGHDHSFNVDSEELGKSIQNLVSIVRLLASQGAL